MTETKANTATMSAALSIAGSDSGGGAGIQADLFTFNSLEVFGTTAITCITAQNPAEVAGIEPITPGLVKLQIETVHKAFPITATKTGMLFSMDVVLAVVEAVRSCDITNLVVDPVMISSSGVDLLQSTAIETLCTEILPLARIITPNIPEAELLTGIGINSENDMMAAGEAMLKMGCTSALIKGGHADDQLLHDVLFTAEKTQRWQHKRLPGRYHGTGCTLSAAIAAGVAADLDLVTACDQAITYVQSVMKSAITPGSSDLRFLAHGKRSD